MIYKTHKNHTSTIDAAHMNNLLSPEPPLINTRSLVYSVLRNIVLPSSLLEPSGLIESQLKYSNNGFLAYDYR
jgi:hypothetical protein